MRNLLILCLLTACATRPIRPDDMSAADHLRAANAERDAARDDLASFRGEAEPSTYLVPYDVDRGGGPDPSFFLGLLSPTVHGLYSADRHLQHAQEHEHAALALAAFEDQACADFAPAERAACPLLSGVLEMADVPGGVRLRFAASVDVAATVKHMRCHLAYARTQGFAVVEDCPLYQRGVHVERVGDSRVIDILAPSAATARTVRLRAREEVLSGTAL